VKNIFTATEARFLPNAPTQNRPPDSRLQPSTDSARSHHRRHNSLVCISCYQGRHRQNSISIFPHRTNGGFIDLSVLTVIQNDRKVTQPTLKYLLMVAIQYSSIGLINTQYRCNYTRAHAGHIML
jgi:hypothetical protein